MAARVEAAPRRRRRARFYVVSDGGDGGERRRYYLNAADLDTAIAETAGMEAAEVGQIVDIYRVGRTDPVAVMVDVEG